MKTLSFTAIFLVICAASFGGTLLPPGAPAPTMKPLDEVEPRIAVTGPLPLTLSGPGSYYLTDALTLAATDQNGITIDAANVTLDLNGFAVTGPGSGTGIGIFVNAGANNFSLCNGTVGSWGSHGIEANSTVTGCVFDGVRCQSNGGSGMAFGGANAKVCGCLFSLNGLRGVYAGSGSEVTGTIAEGNSGEYGIKVGEGGLVLECTSRGNAGIGISASAKSTVRDCVVSSAGDDGIYATMHCTVEGNVVGDVNAETSVNGIYAGDNCVICNNSVRDINIQTGGSGTVVGIKATNGCVISGNTIGGNWAEGAGAWCYGVFTYNSCRIMDNTVNSNDCAATSNGAVGIAAVGACLVSGNVCMQNGVSTAVRGGGISVSGSGGMVRDNVCSSNCGTTESWGIKTLGSGNTISGNRCQANGGNPSNTDIGINIQSNDNVITGNQCGGNGQFEINVGGTGNYIASNLYDGNLNVGASTVGTGDLANVAY